jgi:chromosome segregation ATPase
MFVGTLLNAAEQTAKAAEKAAGDWAEAGWQVKKRPGQLVPEIRPNAQAVDSKASHLLDTGKVDTEVSDSPGGAPITAVKPGSIASATKSASSLLSSRGAIELKSEFSSFLVQYEDTRYRTSPNGEIIFASQDDLSSLVVEFSYGKLTELAASARALARYVEDLEGELESADEEVVALRKDINEGTRRISDVTKMADQYQSEADQLALKLTSAQQEIEEKERVISEAERAAERVADQMLSIQKTSEGKNKGAAEALRLERELMAAEASADDLAETKARLEISVNTLKQQQQEANERRLEESQRLREMERRANTAEAQAEKAAQERLAADLELATLQSQLEQLKSGIDVTDSSAISAQSSAGTSFSEEAKQLSQEIQSQLQGIAGTSGDSRSPKRPALSKMRKADLVAECKERGLASRGTVPELRVLLRVERKRDKLVAQLAGKGWSDTKARSALDAASWDLKVAKAELEGQR